MAKKIKEFDGFSEETYAFFKELGENNNRDWFHANKKRYEEFVREPSKAFVVAMVDQFVDKGLPFIGDVRKSLFRINRDIRFSANKDPYKTNMGAFFPFSVGHMEKKPVEALGLYFHYDLNETFIAGGIHMPVSPVIKVIRTRLAEDHEEFRELVAGKSLNKEFSMILWGEKLKGMPRGYKKGHPAEDVLKLKEYTFAEKHDFKDTCSVELLDRMIDKAEALMPVLEFLDEAIQN
jgi:uncharacterized protein (TIGR02453 family)